MVHYYMDQKSTSQQLFNLAEEVYKSLYHVIFLEGVNRIKLFQMGCMLKRNHVLAIQVRNF